MVGGGHFNTHLHAAQECRKKKNGTNLEPDIVGEARFLHEGGLLRHGKDRRERETTHPSAKINFIYIMNDRSIQGYNYLYKRSSFFLVTVIAL